MDKMKKTRQMPDEGETSSLQLRAEVRCGEQAGPASYDPMIRSTHAGATVRAGRHGEWLDPEDLRAKLVSEIEHATGVVADGVPAGQRGIVVDMSELEHLEAAGLEVLLAAHAELCRRGQRLHVQNCSESLEHWFGYAGADELLSRDCKRSDSGIIC